MAAAFKVFAVVFLVAVAWSGVRVSAQTHHVVGGDKGFKYSGTEDSIVEVEGLQEFLSCNLTNPIKMYTDPVSDVVLEKEGVRYFTSRNPERCKNGLKLPVPVRPVSERDPPFPGLSPPYGPYKPVNIPPPFEPDEHSPPYGPDRPVKPPPFEPHEPSPPYDPYPPVKPTPPYEPPVPVHPPPPPYNPPSPSAAAPLDIVSFMLSAGLLLCYIGI